MNKLKCRVVRIMSILCYFYYDHEYSFGADMAMNVETVDC